MTRNKDGWVKIGRGRIWHRVWRAEFVKGELVFLMRDCDSTWVRGQLYLARFRRKRPAARHCCAKCLVPRVRNRWVKQ